MLCNVGFQCKFSCVQACAHAFAFAFSFYKTRKIKNENKSKIIAKRSCIRINSSLSFIHTVILLDEPIKVVSGACCFVVGTQSTHSIRSLSNLHFLTRFGGNCLFVGALFAIFSERKYGRLCPFVDSSSF